MIFRSQAENAWPWQREKSSLPCKRSKYDVEEGINPGPKMSFLQLLFDVWLSSAFCKMFTVSYTHTSLTGRFRGGESYSASVAAWERHTSPERQSMRTTCFCSVPPVSMSLPRSLTLFLEGSTFDLGDTPGFKSPALTSWMKLGKSQNSLNLGLFTHKRAKGQG